VGGHRGPTLGGGLQNTKSRKTQTGHKDPKKQLEKKKGKPEEKKKTKESGEGEPGRA
jgi:hypothetical protein